MADVFPQATIVSMRNKAKLREKPLERRPYDVYINHRSCDTKHTLASTIYHTLHLIGIHAFLDVEELQMGDSIKDEIEAAIRTARLHIAIFSKRFAESPWCLAELSVMLQTGTPIIPVFYRVDPSDLRWAAQGIGCYAPAFSMHEEKGRYPSNKLQEWKMALQTVSFLPGHVLNTNISDEGMVLKSIVNAAKEHGNFEQTVVDALPEATTMGLRRRKGKLRDKRPCDVYINHRCCDTKHTLASTIYHALDMNNIHAFLDVEELELGDSLPNEVEEAMRTARLHIAIFSPRYAESPWCLAELSYMLQAGTRIIPVFYHVDPSDLRRTAWGRGCYAPAFSIHEEKGRYPSNKLHEWKMALERISSLSGPVLNSNIGDEGMVLKGIVNAAKTYNSDEGMVLTSRANSVQEDDIFKECSSSGNNNNNSTVADHHGSQLASLQTSEVNDDPVIETVSLEVPNYANNNNSVVVGMDEIAQDYNNNNSTSVALSSSALHHGPPHTPAQTSEVNDRFVSTFNFGGLMIGSYRLSLQLFHQFADLASAFNWGALVLVLGNYGLVLSNFLFWMCWSILIVKAVIYNSYESKELEGTTRLHFRGVIILKLGMSFALITLILYKEDITERQNIMLSIIAASVIQFEVVTPSLRGIEELSLRSNQKLKDLVFFIPSTLNAIMSITGQIVVGGDLGRLMHNQVFWGFIFICLIDVFAEVIPRLVNGRRFPYVISDDLPVPKTHYIVLILRMIVEGCLCLWMGKVIYRHSYLTIDECNKLCRERSKHLVIIMIALGSLQVLGTFIAFSLCCRLAHRHDHTLPLQIAS